MSEDLSNTEYRNQLQNERDRTEELDDVSDTLYRVPESQAGLCGNMTTLALGIFFATVLIFLLMIFIAGPLIQEASRKAPGQCIQCPPGQVGPTGGKGDSGGPGGQGNPGEDGPTGSIGYAFFFSYAKYFY